MGVRYLTEGKGKPLRFCVQTIFRLSNLLSHGKWRLSSVANNRTLIQTCVFIWGWRQCVDIKLPPILLTYFWLVS